MRRGAITNRSDREAAIDEAVRRLVAFYRPERIYLFGSAARGQTGPDSDLDFLVIVSDDTPPELKYSNEIYSILRGIRIPMDIVVWSRSWFEERLPLRASLPATIASEGRLLYAAETAPAG